MKGICKDLLKVKKLMGEHWRKEHHYCIECGDKLPLGYDDLICPYCKKVR